MPEGKPFVQKGMIDSHFHLLGMKEKELNLDIELRFCHDTGMFALLDIGIEPDDLIKRVKYKRDDIKMLFAAGIYPGAVSHADSESAIEDIINLLEKTINDSPVKPCAIGECGIDNFHKYGTPQLQRTLFDQQIELANKMDLPIIIHNREADKEIIEALQANPVNRAGIIHCFSSDKKTAFKLVELGFKISFAGNITYKNSPDIEEAAKKIPANAILAETDSPYLTPQAVRKFFNVPSYVGYIYEKIAILRNHQTAEMVSQVKRNFISLFPELRE